MPLRQKIKWFGFFAVLALSNAAFSARAELRTGDALPDLSTFQLEGNLPDSLKGKVVLIDFWASWCAPCAKSFPVLDELQKKFQKRGFTVLAVSVDKKQSDMDGFLKKHPVSFPVVRDAAQKLVAAANVEAMPTSFIVDAEGKVRFVHNGFHGDETKKKYGEEIESLLKGKP